MTESELIEVNGLMARFYGLDKTKKRRSDAVLFDIQRRLLVLGVQVENPVGVPDPRAPDGGCAVVLRMAA